MTATVIIATTGVPELKSAIKSVLEQTYPTKCYVVADGIRNHSRTRVIVEDFLDRKNIEICYLPLNVGADGFYGHRVYAAFTHLVDTEYVLYLDHDNLLDKDHVQTCINLIEKNKLDWCYSLRKIIDKEGNYLCNDDCESLGKWPTYHGVHLTDTNTFCIKTEVAIKLCQVWHMKWGADRVFPSAMSEYFPNFDCTGKYTSSYRVNGNPGSVNKEFFENGNKIMTEKYNGVFPWRK
jgi:glycosyltransferase involved in cell wall biosynthesis